MMARPAGGPELEAEVHQREDCQLDEEFLQRLNRTLERDDIEANDWQLRRGKWRQVASELAKWVWYIGGLFAQIDLFGGHQEDPTNRHYWRWSHHENFDRRFTRARLRWWPYVSLPLYTISSLRILINIYYQYVYDFNFLRQQVFLALTNSQSTKSDISSMLKSHLDSPFVQTILAAQERLATTALDSPSRTTLLNFSSSIGNGSASNRQQLATGNNNHLSPLLLEYGQQVAVQSRELDLSELGALLQARVAETYATLKRIGAPYIVMTYEVQIVYFFLLASSFVLVVLLTVHYRYRSPFNFSLVRAILDFKHERRLFNRLIVHELNRFISSSRNFTLACVEQSRWFASEAPSQNLEFSYGAKKCTNKMLPIDKTHARAEANRFLLEHALIRKQLQQMALGGQLLPEHRTAAWVDSLSLYFTGFAVGAMGYIFIASLFFAFIFFALSEEIFIDTVSYMDVLTICEAGVLVVLVVPNAVIQICIMVATSVDQIWYSTNVCRRVRECIRVNQRRFIEICEMQQSQSRRRQTIARGANNLLQLQKNNFNPHYEQSSSSLSYGQLIDDSKRTLVMRRQSGTQITTLSSSSSSSVASGTGGAHSEARLRTWKRRNSRLRTEPLEPWDGENESDNDLFELFKGDLFRDEQVKLHAIEAAHQQPLDHSLGIESRCTQMNVDLLRVFITYKIFVAQMRQTTRSFVTFTLACVTLIILSPLQLRIHSPYFGHFTKLMSMLFSLLGTTAVDLCLILLCYMFARCTEIYRSLSSLLAHAVEVMNYAPSSTLTQSADSSSSGGGGGELSQLSGAQGQNHPMQQQQKQQHLQQQIYDMHTIWLLRKELNFPDRVVSQFAIVAFDFRLTYSNLLKIHFWVGLLTLSIFFDDSSSQEFFGRLFNDPFGVFNWP